MKDFHDQSRDPLEGQGLSRLQKAVLSVAFVVLFLAGVGFLQGCDSKTAEQRQAVADEYHHCESLAGRPAWLDGEVLVHVKAQRPQRYTDSSYWQIAVTRAGTLSDSAIVECPRLGPL